MGVLFAIAVLWGFVQVHSLEWDCVGDREARGACAPGQVVKAAPPVLPASCLLMPGLPECR